MMNNNQLLQTNYDSINQNIKLIAKVFQTICDYEKQVEIIRLCLSDCLAFDPYLSYKFFDSEKKGFITEKEIINFLNKNSVYCDLETAKMFISFYNSESDGKMKYHEFIHLIITEKDPTLKRIATAKKLKSEFYQSIPSDLEYTLVKLFMKEIEFASKLICLLRDLSSLDVSKLFSAIDKDCLNYINEEQYIQL